MVQCVCTALCCNKYLYLYVCCVTYIHTYCIGCSYSGQSANYVVCLICNCKQGLELYPFMTSVCMSKCCEHIIVCHVCVCVVYVCVCSVVYVCVCVCSDCISLAISLTNTLSDQNWRPSVSS